MAGCYQLYFWVQRNNFHKPARCLVIGLDKRIPFRPEWVWVYSFLYYFMFGLTVTAIPDYSTGVSLVFGGIVLLVLGSAICYFFPTYVPVHYRNFEITSLSTRYLSFVQSMDNNRNAFPSMHCAIATYVGLTVNDLPRVGPAIGYSYIVLIILSCLLVKQHVILDTLAGVGLGAVVFLLL